MDFPFHITKKIQLIFPTEILKIHCVLSLKFATINSEILENKFHTLFQKKKNLKFMDACFIHISGK